MLLSQISILISSKHVAVSGFIHVRAEVCLSFVMPGCNFVAGAIGTGICDFPRVIAAAGWLVVVARREPPVIASSPASAAPGSIPLADSCYSASCSISSIFRLFAKPSYSGAGHRNC